MQLVSKKLVNNIKIDLMTTMQYYDYNNTLTLICYFKQFNSKSCKFTILKKIHQMIFNR